jgi:hypothetical protein
VLSRNPASRTWQDRALRGDCGGIVFFIRQKQSKQIRAGQRYRSNDCAWSGRPRDAQAARVRFAIVICAGLRQIRCGTLNRRSLASQGNACPESLSVFAEFYRKAGKATFANSA